MGREKGKVNMVFIQKDVRNYDWGERGVGEIVSGATRKNNVKAASSVKGKMGKRGDPVSKKRFHRASKNGVNRHKKRYSWVCS